MRQTIGSPNYMQVFDYFLSEPVIIGFPTSEGSGNATQYDASFTISLTTENGDAVWKRSSL
jgi:hypothetical protein